VTGINETDDDRLRALLHDAVSDVEPRDGLAEVRRRTRARRTPSRRWAPVLLGAGAVTATVVAATFVVNGLGDDPDGDGDPPVAQTSQAGPTTAAAGLYFVGDTATGPRLFREFQAIGIAADPEQEVLLALQRLTADSGPRDPDYRTSWPADSFGSVRVEDDERIVVELGTGEALEGDPAAGRLGVQQAVYTAEAALGDALPVSFEWDGQPARQVLGLTVGTVVDRDRSFDITAPVNITDPAEQLAVEGDVLLANGTMASYVNEVAWSLRSEGGDAVLEGIAEQVDITGPDARATLGSPGWETGEIDVSGLAPGDYVFVAAVTDTGQTSDQPVEFSDTRTITVR
jgi:phage baseplate assembly protein gpV